VRCVEWPRQQPSTRERPWHRAAGSSRVSQTAGRGAVNSLSHLGAWILADNASASRRASRSFPSVQPPKTSASRCASHWRERDAAI
jgi:hypothetical protein